MASYSLSVATGGTNTGYQNLSVAISSLGNALGTYLAFRLTTGDGPNTSSALTSAQITTMNNNSLAHFARSGNWDSSSTATSITLTVPIPSQTYTLHMTPAASTTTSNNQQTTRLYAQASNSSWYQIGTTTVSYYKGYAWCGSITATSDGSGSQVTLKGTTRAWYTDIGVSTTNSITIAESNIVSQASFTSATNITLTGLGTSSTYTVYLKGKDGIWYRAHRSYAAGSSSAPTRWYFRLTTTPVITAKSLTYTGSSQSLVTKTGGTNKTIYYKLETSGSSSTTIPSATDAGIYHVYWYSTVSSYYIPGADGSSSNWQGPVTVTLAKADIPETMINEPVGKTLTYTGSAQQLITAGSLDTNYGTMMYRLGTSGNFTSDATTITATNEGSYIIEWYVAGDNNHNDYGDDPVYKRIISTITKPTATWSTQPTIKTNLTYTGSAQQLINAGASSGGTPYYRIGTSGTWQTSVTVTAMKGTNAGTYTVQCYIAGDSTHTDSSILTLSPVINKADITTSDFTAPTGVSVYYDGNYHQLINAGSVSSTIGTMYYKQDGPGQTWVTDAAVITASEEGEYWTYWKITGSSNYNDYTPSPEYIVSTILAMPTPTYTAPTGRTTTWTTGNINLITAGTVTNGSFYYKVGTGSWSQANTIPTTTAVGSYTIYWYIKGNTGYADIGSTTSPAGSVSTTINKADITQYTAPTVKTSLTYTGSSQQLINTAGSVTNSYGTMYYKCPDAEIDWTQTASNIVGTNAGDYLVYYYIVGDSNHNNVGSTSSPIGYKTATIGKAASSWSSLPTIKTGLKYTGSAQALINLGSAVGGTAKYKLSSSSTWLTTAPTASAVGSYYVDYMIVGDANHNDTASAQTDEIIISKGNAYTWTQTPQSKVLASGTSQALVTAGTATGGTKYYKLSTASSYSTSIPTASAAGTYTINYYIAGGTNYEDSAVGSVTSYIYTPPTSKTNLTYNGSPQTLFNNGTAPSSSYTVQYRLASASSTTNWTTTVPSQTNAATYEYHWRIATNTTYSTTALVGGATDTYKLSVTIDKATPTYTAPTGKSLSYTGSNQQLINSAGTVPTGCTMNYRLGTTGTWTTTASSIQASAVNTYTIYYYITGSSNYTDRGSTSNPLGNFTASIGQSVPTYTAPTSKTNLVYTGSSQQLINAGSVTNGTLYYKLNNGTWGTTASSITGTNAGDYTIYYYIKGNTGYSDIGSESNPAGNIITSIAKADPTYTAPSGVIAYYNGNNITLISGGSVTPNSCTFQYKVNSGSWSTAATASSISTDYKVYYYVKGNTNYNDIGSTSNPIGYVTSQILSSVAVYNGTQWVRSSVTGYYESNSIYSKCLIYYYDGSAWQLCGYQEN